MRRRGTIGLLAIVLLSFLVLESSEHNFYRTDYRGEDAHTALLVALRASCSDPGKANVKLQKISRYIYPVNFLSYNLNLLVNESSYDHGALVCRGYVVTNVGKDVFELQYSYKLVGLKVDPLTGRILRIYETSSYQVFKLASYSYAIKIKVYLKPLCAHDYVNGTLLAIKGNYPCTLMDKWGNKLVISGG